MRSLLAAAMSSQDLVAYIVIGALGAVVLAVVIALVVTGLTKKKTSVEEPAEEPAPVEEPAEEPAPVEEPAEESTEEPAPAEEPAEEPAPVEEPVEEPAEEPAPVEEPAEEPAEEVVAAEEPVEEPAEEPAPVEEPAEEVVEEPVEEVAAAEEPAEEPIEEIAAAAEPVAVPVSAKKPAEREGAFGRLSNLRYNKSFLAKLIQSDDTVKSYYSAVKNVAASYGAKSRVSWKQESFRVGRKTVMRLRLRGKTLCAYFALDAADYEGTRYLVEDESDVASNRDVACLYRLKNARRVKNAEHLIGDVMEKFGKSRSEIAPSDYAAGLPYEETEALLKRGLIKEIVKKHPVGAAEQKPHVVVVRHEVKANEVDELMPDEEIKTYIGESVRYADRTKQEIVNVDTLSEYFRAGETVTLEEMKQRIPVLNRKATYIKVLARGTIDKPLTVEADDFSPEAAKMIVLTGGKVIQTKRR